MFYNPSFARIMNMNAVIRIGGLTKQFKQLTAVSEATLSVHRAEIFGLIGPNGAGKSTLIKMLTTLLPPTSGDAWIGGFSIRKQPRDVRRRIGYVPQLLSADGSLTGYENLLLSARLYGIPWRERAGKIENALSTIGLADSADLLVQHYSGGMIRRLEIAQGMMHEPDVLFMDEPTVGLDPSARQMVWDHVEELRRSMGTTMFITTHYMEEADQFCDRIAFIHQGRIQLVGTPAELKATLGPEATLDEVFKKLTGAEIESGGSYRDVRRTRRSVRQHG
jgi:ABC-2 type transport system ATP-binding protein